MSTAKPKVVALLAAALLLVLGACSGNNTDAPKFSPSSGNHPADWMKTHYAEYVKNPSQCRSCHGSPSDAATAGGISGVSCLTCHPKGPDHPTNWALAAQHGRLGAQAAPTAFTGMASCAKCHGADYTGGLVNAASCKTCHVKAPHPSRPWTSSGVSHAQTEPNNAPACYTCHANGANSLLKPATAAPAGTAPGCFNNTMCHGREI